MLVKELSVEDLVEQVDDIEEQIDELGEELEALERKGDRLAQALDDNQHEQDEMGDEIETLRDERTDAQDWLSLLRPLVDLFVAEEQVAA